MINFVKQENETLSEQYYNLDGKLKDLNKAKHNLVKCVNTDIKNMFDSITSSIEKGQNERSAKEIMYVYRYITECVNNLQEYQDPNDINLDSHNNSNYPNLYFEEDNSKTDFKTGKNTYITQNYEKFKQQQQLKDKSTINNSNIGTTSFNNSNFTSVSKSSIIKNLVSKTPIKEDNINVFNNIEDKQSTINNDNLNIMNNNKSISFNKQKLNPNPLTSHLKKENNEKFVNKFLLSTNKNK